VISDKYQLIFVHNPKCAGSSIKNALQGLPEADWRKNDWHYTINQLFRTGDKIEDIFDYKSFGCVRNPYDRLVSAFTYNIERVLISTDYHWDAYPLAYQCLKKYTDQYLTGLDGSWGGTDLIKTFRAFVLSEDFEKLTGKGWPIHFKLQSHFFTERDLDLCLRFEDFMEQDGGLEALEDYTGQSLKVPYTNMSAHPDYQEFYDIQCMDRVAKKYHSDFIEFGYNIHMLGESHA